MDIYLTLYRYYREHKTSTDQKVTTTHKGIPLVFLPKFRRKGLKFDNALEFLNFGKKFIIKLCLFF